MSSLDKAKAALNRLRSNGASKPSASRGIERLGKAMGSVRDTIDLRKASAAQSVYDLELDLEKGVHDAMYHHALCAKAASSAQWGKEGVSSPEQSEKAREHAKQHEFLFLRHALENARKKARYPGDMKYKLQKACDYYDSETYSDEKDPEYKKAVDHYRGGGEFKHHKDDSDFIEDYENGGTPDLKKKGK